MLASTLFVGDVLLQSIADDADRISAQRHFDDPAVRKLQYALLDWDPGCLPRFGVDGRYGGEMEAAVSRFKQTVLGVPVGEIVPDVGPKTVIRLDKMQVELDSQRDLPARIALLDEWLGPDLTGVYSEVATCTVGSHTEGKAALAALGSALSRCVDDRALVVIAGWDFHPGTPLGAGATAGSALQAAAGRGARVRAMLSHFPIVNLPLSGGSVSPFAGDNTASTAFVNGLPNGAAIEDSLVLHHVVPGLAGKLVGSVQIGMHHQKAWVVYDGTRLVAFAGGMDVNPNRTPLGGGQVLHDVQLELDGATAHHVYEMLRQRWNTHPQAPAESTLPPLPEPEPYGGRQRGRAVTTFGDPTRFAGLGPTPGGTGTQPPYPFAPNGSKSYRELLFHLIDKAQRFIYMEDQYLVDEETARRLAAAMDRVQALIMVFCNSDTVGHEIHQAWARRKRFLDHLAPHAAKVAMLVGHPFIHSKVWVFDDVVALVGSANVNRRGLEHDSENGVAFGDLVEPGEVRRLRTALWKAHLGTAAPPAGAAAESALWLWKEPPKTSAVSPYDPAAKTDPTPVPPPLNAIFGVDQFWDEIVDPGVP